MADENSLDKSLQFVLPDSIIVPFTSLDFWLGTEASGLLTANAEGLSLEFQIAKYDDSLWPTVIDRSDVQTTSIPLTQIQTIELKGWLEAKIEIQTNTLAALSKIPGHKQGQVGLSIADKHRNLAKELVSVVQVRLSEHKLAQARRHAEKLQ